MVSNLSAFFSRLNVILEDQNSSALIDLLKLGSSDDAFRSELVPSDQKDFTNLISNQLHLQSIPEGSRDRIISFVNEFLTYASKHQSIHQLLENHNGKGKARDLGNGIQSQKLRSIYDSWALVYARASNVFQLSETIWFIPVLRYIGTTLVSAGTKVDSLDPTSRNSRTTDAASRLSKSAGHAGNDRTPSPCHETKRSAVMWLANSSFRAYFKLNNIRLCETVLGSVDNAIQVNKNLKSSRDLSGEEGYSIADRVTFKYYVGRLRLSQHRITAAVKALRWSFDNCTNSHMHNKRLILIPLVASSMILGIYPCSELLVSASLWDQYGPLIDAIKKGNGYEFSRSLDSFRDWHRKNGTYLIMREKLEVSVWRNLIRRALLISRLSIPLSSAPPILRLSFLLIAARYSWKDESFEIKDMECICASLLDQGYLKAYILHAKSLVVFMKGEQMGIPPISTV